MALEDKFRQHDAQVVDKYHDPNANYTMNERDYVLRPSAHLAGPITITLPKVTDAKGRFYSIIARAASAVNTITITDQNDSECWIADIVFDGKCDGVLLYSDGLAWITCGWVNKGYFLATTHAPGTATATSLAPTTQRGTTVAPTTLATSVAPTTVG